MNTLPKPLNRQIPLSHLLHISQGGLASYISGRRRPDDESLRSICSHWPERSGAQRILLAYLRDQIEIAGLNDSIITVSATAEKHDPQLDADLDLLRQEANNRPEIRPLIGNLTHMIRSSYIAAEVSREPAPRIRKPRLLAAEPPGTYTAKL